MDIGDPSDTYLPLAFHFTQINRFLINLILLELKYYATMKKRKIRKNFRIGEAKGKFVKI